MASTFPLAGMPRVLLPTTPTDAWQCKTGPRTAPRRVASMRCHGGSRRRRDYFAYCGTYEFHTTPWSIVELSLMPHWMGGEQVRHTLDGDTITLSYHWWATAGGQPRLAACVRHRVSNTLP